MRELFTSQSQACWREHIQKEKAARAAWTIRYGHKYLKEGPKVRKQPQAVYFRAGSAVAPRPATNFPVSKESLAGPLETQRVQQQLLRTVGVQSCPPQRDRVWEAREATPRPAGQSRPVGLHMRQVPLSTLQLLFQGISHDGQGRARYLRERHQQAPKEKYPYPIVSSWEYGWHLGKAIQALGRWWPPSPASTFSSPLSSHTEWAPRSQAGRRLPRGTQAGPAVHWECSPSARPNCSSPLRAPL